MFMNDIGVVIVQAHVQVEYLDRDSNQCASDKPSSSRGIMVGFSDTAALYARAEPALLHMWQSSWMNGLS